MQKQGLTAVALVVSLLCVSLRAQLASAALINNLSFNQEVGAYYVQYQPQISAVSPATTTTTPFQTTVTANNAHGGSVTGNYNVTDNGAVAAINISASGVLTANYNNVVESSFGPQNTTFYLFQAVAYTATISTSGPTSAELVVDDGVHTIINIATASQGQLSTVSMAGTALPGTIEFFDSWGIPTNQPPAAANEAGTYTLSLTFTAIPEPSAVGLIAIPVAALLLGRRGLGRAGLMG